MYFSDFFNVNPDSIRAYGAVNISLVCDMPLFIDPMLIFNSEKPEYKALHEKIIEYFHFLARKAKAGLTNGEIKAWFSFSEVKNNWLGYSLSGNGGLALGWDYAKFLYNNIGFAVETNSISKSVHIEKIMLLYKGSGKDKISDLTVNLIKQYLLEYTQQFAEEYIDAALTDSIPVERAYFNYATTSFVSKEYRLPFIRNTNNEKEYVILTPMDILRRDEPSINRSDFCQKHERIRAAIDNDVLRAHVNNYIFEAVQKYEREQEVKKRPPTEKSISRIEKEAFLELAREHPELYDYYIRLREGDSEEIRNECLGELNSQLTKLLINAKALINSFLSSGYKLNEALSAREEAQKRLEYFKHVIEDCEGYRNFYYDGIRVSTEDDIRRIFRYVWYETTYKVDFDTNNGRGEADVITSKGKYNQNIIEFKLASNSRLSHVFAQVDIYEKANTAEDSLVAIFYFSEEELIKVERIIADAGKEDQIGASIFLIDCRNDNKPSASKV